MSVALPRLYAAAGAEAEPLHGHWFTVSPVGTVERVDSSPPATFLAGDGMVYRLDLAPGAATLSSALVEDPTLKAHEILHADRRASPRRYTDIPEYVAYGVAIISLGLDRGLGSRLLANTALQPIDVADRPLLLVTTDGGRPLVFDPSSMCSIGALGAISDWRPALLGKTVFPFVNTTAHPAYDGRTRELYSINFARDLTAELAALGHAGLPFRLSADKLSIEGHGGAAQPAAYVPELVLGDLCRLRPGLRGDAHDDGLVHDPVADVYYATLAGKRAKKLFGAPGGPERRWVVPLAGELVRALRSQLFGSRRTVGMRLAAIVRTMYSDVGNRFTDLLRWSDDFRELTRFRVECDGEEVSIVDSAHQMAVTRDHVLFADTQFKFALTLVLSNALGHLPSWVARTLRKYLTRPQSEHCRLFIVRRRDLAGPGGTVQARCVVLDAEVVHFFAEYDDSAGIELTAVHQRAMDGAEFVAESDRIYGGGAAADGLVGMFPMALDRNEVARYRIQPGARGPLKPYTAFTDDHHTWMVGIGAGPGIGTWERANRGRTPPDSIPWTAWYNEGFLPELLTLHTYELYRDYRGRTYDRRGGAHKSLRELEAEVEAGGRPATFFAAAVAADRLLLHSALELPPGVQLVSPQWSPARDDPSHPGFIVAVVFRTRATGADERTREVWVFRADRLGAPILRFDASAAGWQYTLHTAWLDSLVPTGTALRAEDVAQFAFERDLTRIAVAPNDPIEGLLREAYARLPGIAQ